MRCLNPLSRRKFIHSALATSSTLALVPRVTRAAEAGRAFSFVLLGDLHYDRLGHHNMDWLTPHKPDDVRQVENYTRITRDITPQLFTAVRHLIEDQRGTAEPVAFVLQVGDLVEGLCGSETLAAKQNQEAIEFVNEAKLGAPFLFTKGNHDVTGPGSTEAFDKVFLPFLTGEAGRVSPMTGAVTSARYTITKGNAQFAFFDAYDQQSLDWLESVAGARTVEHLFVTIHPPVVPYGARATWHIYSAEKDKAKREKLLEILTRQEAYVLGGHIHKFNALARTATRGKGRLVQLALSSIINSAEVKPKDLLSGVEQYNGDQVRVEPDHSPGTERERRAVYAAEKKFVSAFEYADLPGYALVTVDGPKAEVKIFSGVSRELWRTIRLDKLLTAAG